MKNIIKIFVFFVIGGLVGGAGTLGVICLFGDKSFAEIGEKLLSTHWESILWESLKAFVFLIIAIYLQIILHECGHLLCGLFSGYKFVSFRILNLTFVREKGKLCVKRFDIAGTGGQCLLSPPDLPVDKTPVALYNLGGVLMNLFVSLLALGLWSALGWQFGLYLGIFGILFALLNGIPLKMGGIGNDGYNQLLLRRNPSSKRALLMQLRINARIQAGEVPLDLPEEWFSKEEPDYQDALQIGHYLMNISRLQESHQWESAYNALKNALKHQKEIIGIFVKEILCELLYTTLVLGKNEEARRLYTDDLKAYIDQFKKYSSTKQRLLFAIALYRDHDPEKARAIYEEVSHKQKSYLMQGEVKMDLKLMEDSLNDKMSN